MVRFSSFLLFHSLTRAHTLLSKYVAVQMHIKESVKGPVTNSSSILAVTGTRVTFQGDACVKGHLRKRLNRGWMCLLEDTLLRDEWYSMYTVSSAPDMELMVPARRDT